MVDFGVEEVWVWEDEGSDDVEIVGVGDGGSEVCGVDVYYVVLYDGDWERKFVSMVRLDREWVWFGGCIIVDV